MVEVLSKIQPNSELLSAFDAENGWNVESFILIPPYNSQIWMRNLNLKRFCWKMKKKCSAKPIQVQLCNLDWSAVLWLDEIWAIFYLIFLIWFLQLNIVDHDEINFTWHDKFINSETLHTYPILLDPVV